MSETDSILPKVVATVRASAGMAAQDVDFFKNIDPAMSKSIDATSQGVLNLINDLFISIDEDFDPLPYGKEPLEDSWKGIGNLLDSLFEKSDHAFDTIKRQQNNAQVGANGNNVTYLDENSRMNDEKVLKRIEKPQKHFKTPIDNSESHPFKPLLQSKPHALKSLEESLTLVAEEEGIPAHYPHPYETEIDQQPYSDEILVKHEPIASQPWDTTDCIWVDTVEEMNKMLASLKKASEIAVDLEHHDYRSYYGLVCLMQISTRDQDWLVDTLALREELSVLNEVFADPSIVKVFHGAFMDIIWLQRDLGLYVVGLFDTYHASRLLGFPKHSLAYLLETYAHFKTSKKYQLADWRIRPLTPPMRAYARADTHFLLNIFDLLRNMLIEQEKLNKVLYESRNVAKRRFEYSAFRPKVPTPNVVTPIEKEDPWRNMMFQYNIPLAKENLMRDLYEWRESVAKRDDESPRYVMPNQLLVSLVAVAPTDPAGVLSVSNFISDHVRMHSKQLCELIKASLEKPVNGSSDWSSNVEATKHKEIVTVGDVERYELLFSSLQNGAAEGLKHEKSGNASVLFGGNDFLSSKAVSFSKGKKNIISEKVMQKRETLLAEKLNEAAVIPETAEHEVLEESNEKPDVEMGEAEAVVATVSEPVVEAPVKENRDEIIVLKKKQVHVHKKADVSASEDPKAAVDYSKMDKILVFDAKEQKKKNKAEKRKFDPYAEESNGPQGVKRANRKISGKHATFSNKKKR